MDASLASCNIGITNNWDQTTIDFINEPPAVDFDNPQTAAAAINVSLNAFRDEMTAQIMASDLPDAVKEDAVAKVDMMINAAMQPGVDADIQSTVQEVFGDTATQFVEDFLAGIMRDMMAQDLLEQAEEALSSGSEDGKPAAGGGGAAGGAEAGGTGEAGESEAGGTAESDGSSAGSSSAGGGSGNWLVKLAQALAEVQNKHLDSLMAATEKAASAAGQDTAFTEATPDSGTNSSGQTEEQVADGNAKSRAEYIRANAEVTAYSRLFSMSSETTSNVIKTVGEGLTSIARKQ